MAVCKRRQKVLNLLTLLLLTAFRKALPQEPVVPLVTFSPERISAKTVNDIVKDITVSCGTPKDKVAEISSIKQLTISRLLIEARHETERERFTVLTTAENTEGDRTAKASAGVTNYSVSGEIPRLGTEATISVTIRRPGCWDSGYYICRLSYQVSNQRLSHQASSLKLLAADPSDISLTVEPKLDNVTLEVGAQLRITCSGNVGTIDSDQYTIIWAWQFRLSNAYTERWLEYDGDRADITDGPVVKENCFEKWTSTLNRTLLPRDSNRLYRCLVRRVQTGVFADELDFEQTAQTFRIPDFLGRKKIGVGLSSILGIIFGLITCIGGACFGIFFYRKRKLKQVNLQKEITKRQTAASDRRKSLAVVVEKRKTLQGGKGNAGYDQILDTLAGKDKAKPVKGAADKSKLTNKSNSGTTAPEEVLAVEESSVVESSVAAEESSVVESSMASEASSVATEPSSVAEMSQI